eukprot:CAMPEP_0177654494 /NCGR_PEP_ID=MMETSP0447-20121125/14366_1 /TAXON_ID=0 /ORGANISM="Stygamoeba regulata, Strain BSH-02190019" /LENGTH=764 /DNA_ID=CAMNT_0019158155 /DNA_START=75 /DNA_END=2366 /DNA_ORIENTATION=+
MSKKIVNTSDIWDRHGRKLFVYVIEAQGLIPTDSAGASADPILKLTMGKETRKTRPSKKTITPKWKELFYFFDPEESELYLEVWCHKKGKFLGQASICSLDSLREEQVVQTWYDLTVRPGKKKDKVTGKVLLRLFYSTSTETRPERGVEYRVDYEPYISQFKTGDLLIFSGRGILSTMTQLFTGYPFSRVGMIVQLENKWTHVPELYVVELTRNVDNFLDAFSDKAQQGCCIFRLLERCFQFYGNGLWWSPLKVPLEADAKQRLMEYVWRVHSMPSQLFEQTFPFDNKLINYVTQSFGERLAKLPLAFIDLYSGSFVTECLRLAGLVPNGTSKLAAPFEVVNYDCYQQPVSIRSDAGTIPSQTIKPSTSQPPPEQYYSVQMPASGSFSTFASGLGGSDSIGRAGGAGSIGRAAGQGSIGLSGSSGSIGRAAGSGVGGGSEQPGPPSFGAPGGATGLPPPIMMLRPTDSTGPGSGSGSFGRAAGLARAAAAGSSGSSGGPSRGPATAESDGGRLMVFPDFSTCDLEKCEKLGSGAFGAVWRVSLGGYSCAVKIVKIDKRTDQYDIDSLKSETAILEKADHPNIVRYLGHHFQPTEMHLFLEFMPHSLRSILDDMTPSDVHHMEVKSLALQIAKGLNYLHNLTPPIIHRDIKSGNILCTKNTEGGIGMVKLCDFGVSKLVDRESSAQTYVGTLAFMAPEIRQGKGRKQYTPAVDVWSFGILLWEILALELPKSGSFKRPSHLGVEFSPLLELQSFCCQPDPKRRPP